MNADKLNGYFRMISTFILFVMRPAAAVAITKYMYPLLAIQIKCRGHYVYRSIPCILDKYKLSNSSPPPPHADPIPRILGRSSSAIPAMPPPLAGGAPPEPRTL